MPHFVDGFILVCGAMTRPRLFTLMGWPGAAEENDFFILPRSDELLSEGSSCKPHVVSVSAGAPWLNRSAP